MRRLKLRFLLLGLALLVPIALLVDRALESVEFEQQARHDAVAERVFDEIERELSSLLAREEARPFGAYAFYFAPDFGKKPRAFEVVSPLAALPEADWLIGYFQLNPDGSFETPHEPLDRDRALREGDWTPSLAVDRRTRILREAIGRYGSGSPGSDPPAPQDEQERAANFDEFSDSPSNFTPRTRPH